MTWEQNVELDGVLNHLHIAENCRWFARQPGGAVKLISEDRCALTKIVQTIGYRLQINPRGASCAFWINACAALLMGLQQQFQWNDHLCTWMSCRFSESNNIRHTPLVDNAEAQVNPSLIPTFFFRTSRQYLTMGSPKLEESGSLEGKHSIESKGNPLFLTHVTHHGCAHI